MRKEMVIRVQTGSEKGHSKAIKVAAAISGVESVTIAGEDRNLLLVIGVGIDSDRITKKLRRKVGHAEVVELRTVDAAAVADDLVGGRVIAAEHAYRYHASPSPYKHHHHSGARDHYYGGGMDHYYAGGSAYAPAPPLYHGGGYPAQYQQHDYFNHPAAANTHTVVHHEYASDPSGCSIM
ncbi:heavy metal-associated isoprenylated plant protein 47-like [Miscanthus floridulus]|uniref:heavy metal-associated isoprenylated plant protein 47-like n=1 Tax=Miscanthus floridulus TaxID=154761 RepID=UPI00345931B2